MATIFNEVVTRFKSVFDSSSKAVDQALQSTNTRLGTANKLMEASGLSAVDLNQGMKAMGLNIEKNGGIVDNFGKSIKMSSVSINELRKNSFKFNMNLLTILFTMMALNRVFSQFLRSAITTYQKANEDTQGLGKATWELQAAWEFFKYSLIDALTQSDLFKMIVQWLLEIVKWFNKLPQGIKQFIIWAAIILYIITLIGLWYAIMKPFIQYMSKLNFWKGFGAFILILLGIILLIKGFKKILTNWGKDWANTIQGIVMVFMGAGLIIAGIALATGYAIFAGFMVGLVLILAAVYWVVEGFKSSWEDGINRLIKLIGVLAIIFVASLAIITAFGVASGILFWTVWTAGIALIVAAVVLAALWIVKNWNNIKIWFLKFIAWLEKAWITVWAAIKVIFWKALQFLFNWNMLLLEGIITVIVKIHQGFIWLWYGIKKSAIEVVKFVLNIFLDMAMKLLSLLGRIPGMGAIVSGLKSGIDAVRGAVDNWGSSLESVREEQLKAAEAPLEAVKALRDAGNAAFNEKIAQINDEANAQKKAVDAVLATEIKAIEIAQKAKEDAAEAQKKANQEASLTGTNTGSTGLLSNILPQSIMPTTELAGLGQSTNINQTKVEDNRQYTFTGLDKSEVNEIIKISNEEQMDLLNRKNDSTLV